MAKLMRYIARILALIWAAWLTLFSTLAGVLICAVTPVIGWDVRTAVPIVAREILVPWAAAVIPWRRETIGGVVPLLVGSVSFIVSPPNPRDSTDLALSLAFVHLPPLVAGSLFLASWWRSRRSGIPQGR